MIADRAMGCMIGQAVGDALGFRYQYRSGEDVKNQIATDRDNSGFLPIRGSTVFDFPPGQLSDGSELCMVVTRSLCRNGTSSTPDIISHLMDWADSDPLNMDETILNVLNFGGQRGSLKGFTSEQIEQRVLSNAFRRNMCNLSNKCLYIAAPLAVSSVHSDGYATASGRIARLLQPNPIVIDALRALSAGIRSLLIRNDVQKSFEVAYNTARTCAVRDHIAQSRHKPHPQQSNDYLCNDSYKELPIDYLGIALQCAFYQLLHTSSFAEGVINALHLGDDTTSNAAITAALLGARFGETGIPKQWKDTVILADLDRHCALPDVYFGDIRTLVNKLLTEVSL